MSDKYEEKEAGYCESDSDGEFYLQMRRNIKSGHFKEANDTFEELEENSLCEESLEGAEGAVLSLTSDTLSKVLVRFYGLNTTGHDGDQPNRAESSMQTATHTGENSGAADDLEQFQGEMMEVLDAMQLNIAHELSSSSTTAAAPVAARETVDAAAESQSDNTLDSQPTESSTWASSSSNEKLAQEIGASPDSLDKVVKIQSGFRAQKVRKEVTKKRKQLEKLAQEIGASPDSLNKVVKIQSGFRGKKARKDAVAMKAVKDAQNSVKPLTEEQKNAQAALWNMVAIASGKELHNIDDIPESTPFGSGLSTK